MKRVLWIQKMIVICMIAVADFSSAAGAAAVPDVLGQWHGNVQTAAGTFALELTVNKDDQGRLAAALESVDQAPGKPIPASRVEFENDQLRLAFAALSASYVGRFDAEKDAWIGSWQQGPILPLTWLRGPLPVMPTITDIDGIWRGTLNRNGNQLHLILHIDTSARGTRAKLDSPDMGIAGMDVTELSRDSDHLHLRVPLAKVVFDATLSDNKTRLSGSWHREGQPEATVLFAREVESAPLSQQRPQTPHAPFNYAVEPVRFRNNGANISLAGTLTLPNRPVPVAAAILISGSGPQDRDESLFGHKPFAVLADHLTRNGIAVLRFDDRGVGESGGDFARATNADFASDVRAAVDFLATRPEINAKAIGLIGHSQGGIVGPIAANHNLAVAYIVLLAAPGTGMTELLISQRRMAGLLQGQSEASLLASEAALKPLYAAAAAAKSRSAAQARISALLTPHVLQQLGIDAAQKSTAVEQFSNDWLLDVLKYDPASTLGALTVPILAVNGSLDRQVPAAANLAAIRRATAKNPDVMTQQLAGLNHLFQTARSGAMAEYAQISETFAPSALQLISDWINKRFTY